MPLSKQHYTDAVVLLVPLACFQSLKKNQLYKSPELPHVKKQGICQNLLYLWQWRWRVMFILNYWTELNGVLAVIFILFLFFLTLKAESGQGQLLLIRWIFKILTFHSAVQHADNWTIATRKSIWETNPLGNPF